MGLRAFRTTRLLITAAGMEIFTGLAIYVAPQAFPAALYGALVPFFPYISAGFMAGGISLLLMVRYPLPGWARRLMPLLSAVPLSVFAWHLAKSGGITGMINYAGVLAALLIAPWISEPEDQQSLTALDLMVPTLSAILAATGMLMLLLPGKFNSTAFAPISGAFPVLGAIGIGGAIALLLPWLGLRPGKTAGILRKALVIAVPVVLTATFIRTGAWNGVPSWGVWVLAVLSQGNAYIRRLEHPSVRPTGESDALDNWPVEMERSLETWMWTLALILVALTAMGGSTSGHVPIRSSLFVVAVTLYNTIANWVFPHRGEPQDRLTVHLTFLTLLAGLLLSDNGPIHLAMLPLLTAIPLVEARSKGYAAGQRILALVVIVVLFSGLDGWLVGHSPSLVVGNTVVMALVLTGSGLAGVQAAGAQRRMLEELAEAHGELRIRNSELQDANESLQAQREELAAQQDEMAAQHEELIQQSSILLTQRDQVEASERHFRLAFYDAPIGMTLRGPDGRILQVNRAFCDMIGYDEDFLVGSDTTRVTHPDDQVADDERLAQIWSGTADTFHAEKRYVHRSGKIVWTQLHLCVVRNPDGTPMQFISHTQDITEKKQAEEQLLHMANYDPLTDLFNRRRFQEELDRSLAHSVRYNTPGAILFLDLDQFKYVNDTLGHRAGDLLLRSLATLLRRRLRQTDIIARLGGDEFAVLLPQTDSKSATIVAEELLRAVRGHVELVEGHPVGITASLGIALFPDHGANAEELLARADLAMYQAKEAGRNGLCMYTPEVGRFAHMEQKLNWETRIREALEQDRFQLHFQPVLNLETNEVVQYELLLRLPNDDGSLIYPGVFLPIAEQFGLITAIDQWVVTKAIQMLADAVAEGQSLCLNVNLSGKTLSDREFPKLVREQLARTGIDPSLLLLEVTETAAIADIEQAREFVESLRALGCRFALDDFGSAWASFYYLKHLPVDVLKIDGSFIERLPHDRVDQELVKAITEVARRLGKHTVAEFVQDGPTMALLKEFGVGHAQGYYIGRPAPHPAKTKSEK